ncbi:hypothetical protein PFISCL1PPCAC_18218, partial [Pristionchus fissidentatus]
TDWLIDLVLLRLATNVSGYWVLAVYRAPTEADITRHAKLDREFEVTAEWRPTMRVEIFQKDVSVTCKRG